MKKTLLLLSTVWFVSLTSCLSNNNGSMTQNLTVPAINIVTSIGTGITSASLGSYTGSLIMSDGTAQFATSNLLFNNSTISVTTDLSPYFSTGYNVYLKNVQGIVSGGSQSQFMDRGSFLLTPFYYPQVTNSEDIYKYNLPEYPYYGNVTSILASRYYIGTELLVRTFQQDTFYQGKTTSWYDDNTNENSEIVYRLVLSEDFKTADLIMYQAKFSAHPMEPIKQAIILKQLPVNYNSEGITISATEVIPYTVEGSSTTPSPSWTFDRIVFQTYGDMLQNCNISFTVAGQYNGSFDGTYIYDDITSKV